MTTEQEICRAIESRQQITYTHDRDGSAEGIRNGNPHIVYRAKNGHFLVDVWKTGGVQSKPFTPLPGWQTYRLENLTVIDILPEKFDIAPGFNSASSRYHDTTCHVPTD